MSRNKLNLVIAIVLTSLIFTTGILIGEWIFKSKLEGLQNIQSYMQSEFLDVELSYELASESLCDSSVLLKLSNDLDEAGHDIIRLEEQKGGQDIEFLNFKKHYFLLELKHWQFVRRMNEECRSSYPTILYFYQIGLPGSEIQGAALNMIKSKYSNVMIYSLDINSDLESLGIVKDQYNITRAPALIINEKSFVGIQSEDKIEPYIQ